MQCRVAEHCVELTEEGPGLPVGHPRVQSQPADAFDLSRAAIHADHLTIALLIGEELPEGAAPDSYGVSSALLGRPHHEPIREAIVSHSDNGAFAIRQGPWKASFGTDGSGGRVTPADEPPSPDRGGQLYNLKEDPGEQTNHYGEKTEIEERLRRLLESYQESGRSAPLTRR